MEGCEQNASILEIISIFDDDTTHSVPCIDQPG